MPRNRTLRAFAFTLALAALPCPVHAERTDRDKPVNLESDRMTADDAKKTATFEGSVVLTQGTLVIRADRIVVRQDESGFQYGVAYGNPARFRQKRDGTDEFVEGEALRLEYDGRSERVEFFDEARLHRDGGDDVRGSYISYDAKTEYFSVNSGRQAAKNGRDSRVRATIMPKKSEPTKPAEPLGLRPAPSIAPGQQ
jgi:lipopolysaccharide export system protein LptA